MKSKSESIYQSVKNNNLEFTPLKIDLKDDAYHDPKGLFYTEWWYFDANLNNGYSAQMNVRVINLYFKKPFLIFVRLDIHKDGRLISNNKKILLLKGFYASKKTPLIKINGKEIIKGHIDNKSGNWVFDLSFNFKKASANLKFVGITKGWKGELPGSNWGVILPKATVIGRIKIGNKEIAVKGSGYHDHNWNLTSKAIFNFGWFWGKLNSKNHVITWATVFKNKNLGLRLLVINDINNGFYNLPNNDIKFIASKIKRENGKLIPHCFTLSAENKDVSLNVKMDYIDTHHVKIMGFMNYWRYHVKCKGSINYKGKSEKIDDVHIAEFFRFK